MRAGQGISKKQNSDGIQQAAQQAWVKGSSVLQLLGVGKQTLLLDRLAFWRGTQPGSWLHVVIKDAGLRYGIRTQVCWPSQSIMALLSPLL